MRGKALSLRYSDAAHIFSGEDKINLVGCSAVEMSAVWDVSLETNIQFGAQARPLGGTEYYYHVRRRFDDGLLGRKRW